MFAVEVDNLRKEFFRRDAARTGLRKRRRRVAALEGVTFTMERGECVAILGQNGSGKSTLVRLLSTLLLPDGGSATIFGHDVVKESRAVQRLVNRVSVEASFFKKMSSEENLAYAARFYGIPPSKTRTAIPEILERVGFPVSRRHEGMEHLSRGMQQKVALARALLTSPVLLLLDEPTPPDRARSRRGAEGTVRGRDARGGVLRRDRPHVRGREGRGRGTRCVRVREAAATLRHEFIGLYGMVERNWYLIKRYAWWEIAFFFWTAANTLTIVFIAKGVVAEGGTINLDRLTTILLIGAVIWSYLGIVFELLIETVAWERWEGTIEYTFMAPLTRAVHLLGTGIFAIGYGIVRASIVFAAIAAFFGLHMPNANFATALVLIAVASISFVGIGMMTAVLPLISPEKGTQFGYVAQGLMLVVSGVYYPVSVLPEFMQWIAKISPATYALRGERSAILDGAGIGAVWGDIWPMLIIGVISVPLGIWVFRRGELHAKKHGKLKRSG